MLQIMIVGRAIIHGAVVYADISVEDNIAGHVGELTGDDVGGAVEDNVGYDGSVDSAVGYGGTYTYCCWRCWK